MMIMPLARIMIIIISDHRETGHSHRAQAGRDRLVTIPGRRPRPPHGASALSDSGLPACSCGGTGAAGELAWRRGWPDRVVTLPCLPKAGFEPAAAGVTT